VEGDNYASVEPGHTRISVALEISDARCQGRFVLMVCDEDRTPTKHGAYKEALNNSSMNSQSTKWMKCDFIHFFIFNGVTAIENGDTSMYRGNSELIRVSLSYTHLFCIDQ
jgi:hypothetical protein